MGGELLKAFRVSTAHRKATTFPRPHCLPTASTPLPALGYIHQSQALFRLPRCVSKAPCPRGVNQIPEIQVPSREPRLSFQKSAKVLTSTLPLLERALSSPGRWGSPTRGHTGWEEEVLNTKKLLPSKHHHSRAPASPAPHTPSVCTFSSKHLHFRQMFPRQRYL